MGKVQYTFSGYMSWLAYLMLNDIKNDNSGLKRQDIPGLMLLSKACYGTSLTFEIVVKELNKLLDKKGEEARAEEKKIITMMEQDGWTYFPHGEGSFGKDDISISYSKVYHEITFYGMVPSNITTCLGCERWSLHHDFLKCRAEFMKGAECPNNETTA